MNRLKNNIKLIFGLVLGITLTYTTVVAANTLFQADEIKYNNSTLTSTNVQDALDELYTSANSDSFWLKKYKTLVEAPQYYAFGIYKGWCSSTDTSCRSDPDFPTTETEPPLGKNVYATKYADGQYGVCIKRNGTEYCFRARDYTAESKHLQEVFSDISCSVDWNSVTCNASDFHCYVNSYGYLNCYDTGAFEYCMVYDSVYCKSN